MKDDELTPIEEKLSRSIELYPPEGDHPTDEQLKALINPEEWAKSPLNIMLLPVLSAKKRF